MGFIVIHYICVWSCLRISLPVMLYQSYHEVVSEKMTLFNLSIFVILLLHTLHMNVFCLS